MFAGTPLLTTSPLDQGWRCLSWAKLSKRSHGKDVDARMASILEKPINIHGASHDSDPLPQVELGEDHESDEDPFQWGGGLDEADENAAPAQPPENVKAGHLPELQIRDHYRLYP